MEGVGVMGFMKGIGGVRGYEGGRCYGVYEGCRCYGVYEGCRGLIGPGGVRWGVEGVRGVGRVICG